MKYKNARSIKGVKHGFVGKKNQTNEEFAANIRKVNDAASKALNKKKGVHPERLMDAHVKAHDKMFGRNQDSNIGWAQGDDYIHSKLYHPARGRFTSTVIKGKIHHRHDEED